MDQPSFRPLRNQNLQPQESKQEEQTVQSSQKPLFQRRQSGQTQEDKSIFPNWDLLPPRRVVRRKNS